MRAPIMYDQYLQERRTKILDDLFEFLKIPSISMTGEGIGAAVTFLHNYLTTSGFEVEVADTAGHPILYTEIGPVHSPSSLLIYGHYDVFPADQEGWKTAPFEPVIAGDRLYARGAGDNKGQIFAHIAAIEMFRALHGDLPCRIKLLIEGEEETGSKSLPKFVSEQADRLRADICFYSDGPMFPGDQPIVVFGVRGVVCLELIARGAKRALHSGNFGGVAPNPLMDLARALSMMVNGQGDLQIEAALDGVWEITPAERQALGRLPLDRQEMTAEMGVQPLGDGSGTDFYERLMMRPYLNVEGIVGGHSGEGIRAVIPNHAVAKLDIRLVGDQDPDRVHGAICEFLREQGFDNIECRKLLGQPPSRTRIDHPGAELVRGAVRRGFGTEPLIVPSLGATTPDYVFTKILGIPSMVVPYAPYDEQNHAPNESTTLSCLLRGIKTTAYLLEQLRSPSPGS
jgi:acetylornithine deacetylase/succinyl-diaminopimelate desuccinylase-like protein